MYGINTYLIFFGAEAEMLIAKIKFELMDVFFILFFLFLLM
jgi:hypothetical protein